MLIELSGERLELRVKVTFEEDESIAEEKIRSMIYGEVERILDEEIIGNHSSDHFHYNSHCTFG